MNINNLITNKEWNEKHKKEIEQGDNMNRYQEFFDKIDSIREFCSFRQDLNKSEYDHYQTVIEKLCDCKKDFVEMVDYYNEELDEKDAEIEGLEEKIDEALTALE